MESPQELVGYEEARRISGLPRRTLVDRINHTGVTIYVDGRDRRKRLIARADLPKLTEPHPVERHVTTAA